MASASLGVADLAGFVDLFRGEADVLDRGRLNVPGRNITLLPLAGDFAPFLRRVVFVGAAFLSSTLAISGVWRERRPLVLGLGERVFVISRSATTCRNGCGARWSLHQGNSPRVPARSRHSAFGPRQSASLAVHLRPLHRASAKESGAPPQHQNGQSRAQSPDRNSVRRLCGRNLGRFPELF